MGTAITLDNCGDEYHFASRQGEGYDATVIMVIKAPRGIMAIFEEGYTPYSLMYTRGAEGIRAFMEQHNA